MKPDKHCMKNTVYVKKCIKGGGSILLTQVLHVLDCQGPVEQLSSARPVFQPSGSKSCTDRTTLSYAMLCSVSDAQWAWQVSDALYICIAHGGTVITKVVTDCFGSLSVKNNK